MQGRLSAEQQHEVEKKMMDNEFTSDALEGLQNFKDQQRLQLLVDQLKKDIRKKIEKKKAYLEKRRVVLDPWIVITIILILVLVAISYFIIHRYTSP